MDVEQTTGGTEIDSHNIGKALKKFVLCKAPGPDEIRHVYFRSVQKHLTGRERCSENRWIKRTSVKEVEESKYAHF